MEGKFIISDTVLIQKPRTPTAAERRDEIEAQTKKLKKQAKSKRRKKILAELTADEKEEWEKQEKLEQYHLKKAAVELDLTSELQTRLAKRKKEIEESS